MWEEHGTPGGWWMIKRITVEKLGLLDEECFFNVFADYDYLWRMKSKLNLRVITTPEVTVQHYGEASLQKFPHRQHEYNKGQWELLNKWKDHPILPKYLPGILEVKDVKQWLEDYSEYSKSINYST
jgi:GT2 family glycosyltransferase